MAILPVQRNPISPVPPLGPGVLDTLLEKWLPQLLNKTYKNRLDTQVPGAASGVSTPLLVLPNSRGIWLVHASIGPVNDAVNYQAVGLVAVDGTSARFVVVWNAPSQTITIGGLTINTTQSSGGVQTLAGTAIQLTHF